MRDIRHLLHRRHRFLVLVAAVLFVGRAGATTLEEVIENNTEAIGGREAIEAVQSIAIDLHIVDPGFTADGTYYAARPGRMRIDIKDQGKIVYTEAFDGRKGWKWNGGDSAMVEEPPKATAALRHGLELPGHLYGLHEMRARGNKLELLDREKIDDISYYVLRLTLADGYTTKLYIDPHSWLVTRRRDSRALHVEVDPTPTLIEQRMSDFRKVSQVTFAFANTETDLKTGKVLETTTTRAITVNPPIDAGRFERP